MYSVSSCCTYSAYRAGHVDCLSTEQATVDKQSHQLKPNKQLAQKNMRKKHEKNVLSATELPTLIMYPPLIGGGIKR